MKALLSNCASAAVQHDPELKAYYQRKVKQGKAKISALNAVRAKLINRVFATVNRGTAYVISSNTNTLPDHLSFLMAKACFCRYK